MNRDVAIVLLLPRKGGTKEEIDVAHEINFDVFLELGLEERFYVRIGGVKHEVVHVDVNMEGCSGGDQ